MMLTDIFVKRPFWTLVVGYSLLITLTQISIDFGYFDISDSSSRDFYIWDDPMTVDLDMFTVASEFFDDNSEALVEPVQAIRSKGQLPVFLLYKNVDNAAGLLRKDILLNIQKLERTIADYPGFRDYCKAQDDKNLTCSNMTFNSPLNVLTQMNATKELSEMGQLEIEEIFRTAFDTIEVKSVILPAFDKNVSSSNMTVTYMRTIISLGSPLDVDGIRFMNTTDRRDL